MPIKTFRGQIKDLAAQRIKLSTNQGLIGYRIVKLQVMSLQPGQVDGEHVVQVYTTPHTDTSKYDNINFDDPTLVGACFYKTSDINTNTDTQFVIFDNMKFNQDIYITHADVKGSLAVNYHLELEQIKLDLNEATVATLKDMRGRE